MYYYAIQTIIISPEKNSRITSERESARPIVPETEELMRLGDAARDR